MDFREEVLKKIGSISYEILLKEITNGHISREELQQIAVRMGAPVNAEFQSKEHKDLKTIFLFMLDRWFKCHLYKHEVNGLDSLISILEKEDLGYLAFEIREAEEKAEKQER